MMLISIQNPIHIDQYSEPEPDIALLQERDDFYENAHPEPEDVLLIIEISDSSLAYDSAEKAKLYAQAGIIELWVIDISGRLIKVHRQPTSEGYKDVQVKSGGDKLTIQAFLDIQLFVDFILT